ncbi:hypothetical protein C3Y87_21130 [Carbonactinospora thermoautotrophica]|nr:hypothetical protein [Carbonactinospora thermoautotrophica]
MPSRRRSAVTCSRSPLRCSGRSTGWSSTAWINRSPGGAGGVKGSRLTGDRERIAVLLGFDGVIEHTRDAMWHGLIGLVGTAASPVTTPTKLAEDLEIWSSSEFGYVRLADRHTRSSVLMPQKRNPYALTMVRGEAGILIGRLTGMLAISRSLRPPRRAVTT